MEEMNELLTHWDPETETLVYLGDAVDRGCDSLGVVQTLYDLKKKHPKKVVVLKGNHDSDFVHWVYSGDMAGFLLTEDIKTTIKSFYKHEPEKHRKDSRKQKAAHIKYNFKEQISFLNHLPLFHETEHCIFVHAGIDLNKEDWRDDGENTFLWIRKNFYNYKKMAPKKVFFGHTPTSYMGKTDNDIWISEEGDKVGIDGACFFDGQLNGVKVDEEGNIIKKIAIKKIE
jgi:serine/threonine protein phosphatase 1